MDVKLNDPELERYVAEQVTGGTFASADEVVAMAVRQMKSGHWLVYLSSLR